MPLVLYNNSINGYIPNSLYIDGKYYSIDSLYDDNFDIKEIKVENEPKDSIRKKDVNLLKTKYSKNIKNINSVIFIQKMLSATMTKRKCSVSKI